MNGRLVIRDGNATGCGEPVEQVDAEVERDLLAGHGVQQGLEQRGKTRGLETTEPGCRGVEPLVGRGEPVESSQIDVKAKQFPQSAAYGCFDIRRLSRARDR